MLEIQPIGKVNTVARMRNTAYVSIDLSAVRENLSVVRTLCPRSRVMAMVKADAYGHGLLPVARALEQADGLAVARLEEALKLRSAGITQRILLLGTLLDSADLELCSHQKIDVTVHDRETVGLIAEVARSAPLRVWLKLDTGFHRLGLDWEAFIECAQLLGEHSGILELIHMTHFYAAEDPALTEKQMARLQACLRETSRAKLSVANSAALLREPSTRVDWVRPGIALYGVNPVPTLGYLGVRPVMTLRARVIAIRHIEVGESVGYGGRWVGQRKSAIGTVGIGYGDGYPRSAQDGTPVRIGNGVAPLVGRVSMDSLTVDLTELPSVKVGDEATLWGPDLLPTLIAEHAGTIPYELFTRVTPRVDRYYEA